MNLVVKTLMLIIIHKCINRFVPNAPFLYHLKSYENLTVFWCFQGLEKVCIGNKWVKYQQLPNRQVHDLLKQLPTKLKKYLGIKKLYNALQLFFRHSTWNLKRWNHNHSIKSYYKLNSLVFVLPPRLGLHES